ncbi:hypothetical protein PHPALM_12810 [Phytophthora palmivora]|uniref:DDE-1 domain-containing protein n=1 Tax=Phytophthora palmivora TaxID=4796 RepID=A0A2P4XYT7_9STRA|nr:hypothetical protein PHPALM_12810 [Phytophthora palmivora]
MWMRLLFTAKWCRSEGGLRKANLIPAGKTTPIMFVIKGVPSGNIDQSELKMYPPGHYYCVLENAWMDTKCWEYYAGEVLPRELDGPSLMLVDNFDCHVSG